MDAVVLVDAAGRQPLHAAYRRSVAGIVGELLAADERRMAALLERLRVRLVLPAEWRAIDPTGRSAANVNEPSDLV